VNTHADPSDAVTLQGHYAGPVTRLFAYAFDQSLLVALFAAGTALVVWGVSLVTAGEVEWSVSAWVTAAAFVLWQFSYYAYPWAVSGRTPGMALIGIRVVRAEGDPAGPREAALRSIVLPLTFLTLGIGFLPIVFGRHRRALHDLAAGTAVVYSWDARAARWRFLARQQDAGTVNAA
jgi:uncharacterized RDD family membrane protein YckC